MKQQQYVHSESLQHQGDLAADWAIHEVTQGSQSAVRNVLRQVVHAPPEAWPEPLASLLDAFNEPLPRAQRQRAEQFFAQHGPEIMLCLCCSSLAHDYLNPRGAQLLVQSGQLVADVPRRLGRTAQMIMDCFAPEGLTPRGKGHVTLTRVRIIHAAARVLAGPTMSHPINQDDLAYAYSSFTWPVIQGLGRLGARISSEQVDAYLTHWQVMGKLLGLWPESIPSSKETARAQFQLLQERRSSSSPAAKTLAKALVETIDGYLPERCSVSGADLIRFFLGAADAEALGLPVPSNVAMVTKALIFGMVRTGLARPWVRELAMNAIMQLCQEGGLQVPAPFLRSWYPHDPSAPQGPNINKEVAHHV